MSIGTFGLSRVVQGAVEGIDKVEARGDRNTRRERTDIQWDQGQEDRNYSLGRRDINDQRSDEEYQKKQDTQAQDEEVRGVMRNYLSTKGKNMDEVAAVFEKYTGIKYSYEVGQDGTYDVTMENDGKKSEPANLSFDEIGQGMEWLRSTSDPYELLKERKANKDATANKKSERAFDMAKLEKEYELKRGLKSTPEGGKNGKSVTAKNKANLAINKELNDIAVQDYGSLFGDQWKFDTTQDKAMRSAQADLAGAYYFSSNDADPSTNSASRAALKDMRKFLTAATAQADADLDEGLIEENGYDNRVADIVEFYTDNAIKKMVPEGESLQRDGGDQQPMSDANTPIPLEAIQQLKADPSDEMKKFFDDTFGPGSADKIINASPMGQEDKASAGVTDGSGGGPSLVREANAGITTKPKEAEPKKKGHAMSRTEKRRAGQKSQKAHRQIAVSEYKNEWVNMDDKEKIAWWAENSSALKAASLRSYKKADKEILAIHSKSRIGRNKPRTRKNKE